MLYIVRGLRDGARGVTIRVRVLKKDNVRVVKTKDNTEHRVVDAMVGDVTGTIIMTLWDENIDKVNEADIVDVKNGHVNTFKGRLRLNVGEYGELSKVEEEAFPSVEQIIKKSRFKEHGES